MFTPSEKFIFTNYVFNQTVIGRIVGLREDNIFKVEF